MYPVTSRSLSRLLTLLPLLLALACSADQPTAPDASILTAKGGGGGGGPSVDAADPNNAPQDTTLDVRVIGSGFDDGSAVKLLLNGQTSKIVTHKTQFVDRKNLIATITIAADADVALYDIEVMTRRGKKGIGTELFSVREKGKPGGDGVVFLTDGKKAWDFWAEFSSDGNTIIFCRQASPGANYELFTIPASGGSAQPLPGVPSALSTCLPTWSPSSNQIYFTDYSPIAPLSEPWLINSDGTNARKLTFASVLSDFVTEASWYPDNAHLAVVDWGESVVKRIDLVGGAAVPLTNHGQVLAGAPAVSPVADPEGRWIAFAGQPNLGQPMDATQNSIWLVLDDLNDATPPAVAVQVGPDQGRGPSWSPDGQWLAFGSNYTSSDPSKYAIFIMRPDGSDLQQKTDYSLNAFIPRWSPDGTRLVFTALNGPSWKNWRGVAVMDIDLP